MDLEQQHADIAWSNFLAQYGNSPRLESVVRALYKPMQGIQGALRQLFEDRWLDKAVGRQLDGIGEIVGQSREIEDTIYVKFFGFDSQPGALGFGQARFRRSYEKAVSGSTRLLDDEYRKVLYWKIAVNNGHGTSPEIVAAMRPIFDVAYIRIKDAGNAKVRIWVSRIPGPNDPLMVNPYRWIPTAAGVGVQILTGSTEKPFGFINQGFFGFGVGVMSRAI